MPLDPQFAITSIDLLQAMNRFTGGVPAYLASVTEEAELLSFLTAIEEMEGRFGAVLDLIIGRAKVIVPHFASDLEALVPGLSSLLDAFNEDGSPVADFDYEAGLALIKTAEAVLAERPAA